MPDEIKPPDDEHDEGMHALIEEAGDQLPPDSKERDEGMAAGKMEVQPEDLPEDPGAPEEELVPPDEKAAKKAPLFTTDHVTLADLDSQIEAPSQNAAHPGSTEMLNLLVTDQDVHQLWQRANRLQALIPQEIQNLDTGRQLLNHIRDGRNEILAGRDHYEEAERFINEVDFRIAFSRAVQKATRQVSWWLMGYEVLIGALLLFVLIVGFATHAFAGAGKLAVTTPVASQSASPETADDIGTSAPDTQTSTDSAPTGADNGGGNLTSAGRSAEGSWVDYLTPDMVYLLVTMLWGGLGGVVGALFALKQHVSEDQDFDPQHTMWYIISPPMGIAVAAGVYLVMRAGLLSLISSADIQSPIIFYVLGFLSGFRHNVFTDLVRRVLNTLQVEEESEPTPPPQAPEKPETQPQPTQPVQPIPPAPVQPKDGKEITPVG
ncbi:MAG: hypothetical protein JW862_10930 [Anaerolineales bacterium]|nr:hypothetical protein [Anaerolineales bacterium]